MCKPIVIIVVRSEFTSAVSFVTLRLSLGLRKHKLIPVINFRSLCAA